MVTHENVLSVVPFPLKLFQKILSQSFNPNRPFWVKWKNEGDIEGQIHLGSGDQVGKHEIFFFADDNPTLVEKVQVSSFEAGVAVWEFSQGIGNSFSL